MQNAENVHDVGVFRNEHLITVCFLSYICIFPRFYDQLKENDYNAPPPRFADCSLHCVDSEMKALNLESKFAGLYSSSLENAYHFAQSTAPMTPPNLSTAAPTGVMGSTTKYMVPYLRNRKLQDCLPKCWKTNEPVLPVERLVKIDKTYDGDSCDILYSSGRKATGYPRRPKTQIIGAHLGQRGTRDGVCGPPLYKQVEGSTATRHVLTRDIGVES